MPGMNHIAMRDIRKSQPPKKARKTGGRKKKGQTDESEEGVKQSAFSLKEPKDEEHLFTDDDENSEWNASVEQKKIKEEEMSDNEKESSHFAISSFFFPALSVDRSRFLDPPRKVKEEEIDEEENRILEKSKRMERIDQIRRIDGEERELATNNPVDNGTVEEDDIVRVVDAHKNSVLDDEFVNSVKPPPFNDHNYARILKRRSPGDDESVTASKKFDISKPNDTVLECSESGATPQCVLCEMYPKTAGRYINHLYKHHKSTLIQNGVYLVCSCGLEVRSDRCRKHLEGCDPRQFTLRKLDLAITQCILCEMYPKTARSYADHLYKHHKSSLAQNRVYLMCSCGVEIRTINDSYKHLEGCDPGQFTLHKLDGDKATPQCVLCEIYPKTTGGYATHLSDHHNSTLGLNGIYLVCSCGLKVRSYNSRHKHRHDCDRRQFTLHKLDDE